MGNVCTAGSAHVTHPSRPHVDSLGSSWAGQSGLSSAGHRALLPVPAETSHPAQASPLPRLPPSCNHASSSLSLPRQAVSWLVAHLSALPEVPAFRMLLLCLELALTITQPCPIPASQFSTWQLP